MNVKRMYHELLVTSLVVNVADAFISGVMVFSVSYLLFYFNRLHVVFAILCGGFVFLRSIFMKTRQNKILLLEKKYPNLRERLRTSFDHQDRSNTIVNELHADIVSKMRNIDIQAIMDSRKFFLKVIITCIFFTTVLMLAGRGVDILDVKNVITDSSMFQKLTSLGDSFFGENKEPFDFLKGEENNISINSFNTELDIDDISASEKHDYGGSFPDEISGDLTENYDEGIPDEYKDAVADYFERINS